MTLPSCRSPAPSCMITAARTKTWCALCRIGTAATTPCRGCAWRRWRSSSVGWLRNPTCRPRPAIGPTGGRKVSRPAASRPRSAGRRTPDCSPRGLAALLSGLRPPFAPDPAEGEHAWRSLALFDEHTWGMDESVTHPASPNTRGALYYKYNLAYEAAAAVTRLAQAGLRDLAARLPQDAAPRVVVFNPLPWPRRVPLYLPRISSTSWALPNLERSLELAAPHAGVTLGEDYGMVDLPAGGYITLPLRTAGPVSPQPIFSLEGIAAVKEPDFIPAIASGLAASVGVTSGGWTLENRFYALRLDPASGAIISLVSKADGHEWADENTPWRLGQYVYETNRSPRGRRDMQVTMEAGPDFDRQPFLAPLRRGPDRVLDCRFVPGVGKGRLALRLEAPVAHDVRFQVVFYEDEPWIDLIYDIDKLAVTEPESVYVTFPLALAQPAAFYHTEKNSNGTRGFIWFEHCCCNNVDISATHIRIGFLQRHRNCISISRTSRNHCFCKSFKRMIK